MSETPTSSPERVVSPTNAISLRRTPVRKATRADGPYVQAIRKKIEGELDRIDEVCAIPRQDSTDRPLACEGFDLAMENVSFSYGGGCRVIDGVTLSIPEGTTCALVGPSGSGKTTLLQHILRSDHGMRIAVIINDIGA